MLQVRSIQSDHDDLVAQNKSLAEYNLSLQPRLDSLKTEVATGYESINKLKNELGMAKARLGNLAYLSAWTLFSVCVCVCVWVCVF